MLCLYSFNFSISEFGEQFRNHMYFALLTVPLATNYLENGKFQGMLMFITGQVGLGVGSWPSNRTNVGSPPSEFDYTS